MFSMATTRPPQKRRIDNKCEACEKRIVDLERTVQRTDEGCVPKTQPTRCFSIAIVLEELREEEADLCPWEGMNKDE